MKVDKKTLETMSHDLVRGIYGLKAFGFDDIKVSRSSVESYSFMDKGFVFVVSEMRSNSFVMIDLMDRILEKEFKIVEKESFVDDCDELLTPNEVRDYLIKRLSSLTESSDNTMIGYIRTAVKAKEFKPAKVAMVKHSVSRDKTKALTVRKSDINRIKKALLRSGKTPTIIISELDDIIVEHIEVSALPVNEPTQDIVEYNGRRTEGRRIVRVKSKVGKRRPRWEV